MPKIISEIKRELHNLEVIQNNPGKTSNTICCRSSQNVYRLAHHIANVLHIIGQRKLATALIRKASARSFLNKTQREDLLKCIESCKEAIEAWTKEK